MYGTRCRTDRRPCCVMSDMMVDEIINTMAARHANRGVISHRALPFALDYLMDIVRDIEASPAGDSSRNGMVLSLVRRTITDRLRNTVKHIGAAIENGHGLAVEELKF